MLRDHFDVLKEMRANMGEGQNNFEKLSTRMGTLLRATITQEYMMKEKLRSLVFDGAPTAQSKKGDSQGKPGKNEEDTQEKDSSQQKENRSWKVDPVKNVKRALPEYYAQYEKAVQSKLAYSKSSTEDFLKSVSRPLKRSRRQDVRHPKTLQIHQLLFTGKGRP